MEIKKEIYNNIKESYRSWNAWKADFTFPLDIADQSFLSKIEIKETVFKSTLLGENTFIDTLLINELDVLLKNFPCRYLWAFGHTVDKKTRLRSYKGMMQNFNYKIDKETKFEIEAHNGNSILGLCINLADINSFELEKLFFELPNSYIITSKNPECEIRNFKDSIGKTLDINGNSCYLNFYKSLYFWFSEYPKNNMSLIRLGGDGDAEMSIQEFYLKS